MEIINVKNQHIVFSRDDLDAIGKFPAAYGAASWTAPL